MGESGYRFKQENITLDENVRRKAPGSFVKLKYGYTHYELRGHSDAPTVVLVHGFSVPYYIWDPTFQALTEQGFRVLRYDLYGRGYSDRPIGEYDMRLFLEQLDELLLATQISSPIDLFGLSMGGAISVEYTARFPHKVRKLCLIDPAGIPMKRRLNAWLIRLPFLGEWILDAFGENLLVAGLGDDMHHPEKLPKSYRDNYRAQMRIKGFRRALLSTLRNDVLDNSREAYKAVGESLREVLLIWGREDKVLPFALHKEVLELIPNAEFHAIDDAGHIPHYERPEAVNPLLFEFLVE